MARFFHYQRFATVDVAQSVTANIMSIARSPFNIVNKLNQIEKPATCTTCFDRWNENIYERTDNARCRQKIEKKYSPTTIQNRNRKQKKTNGHEKFNRVILSLRNARLPINQFRLRMESAEEKSIGGFSFINYNFCGKCNESLKRNILVESVKYVCASLELGFNPIQLAI